jgi:superfamily II DNA or RNA helicase
MQAKNSISGMTGLSVDIEMADMIANESSLFTKADVICGTVQTQVAGSGRMRRFDPEEFATIIIDEAHHATAQTYRWIVDHYGQNPAALILGITATPDRSDEEALGQIFTDCAAHYSILDAVHDGWLVNPRRTAKSITDYDLADISTQAGDFHQGQLSEVLENPELLLAMVDKAAEAIGDRQTLIFAQSVDQSKLWRTAIEQRHGIQAIHIDAETDKADRAQMIKEFNAGKHQVLLNVGIATEGFDSPNVSCIVMARPTKSRSLYSQMLGRGTRPSSSIAHALGTCKDADERKRMIAMSEKPDTLIVDFVGNTGRHKVVSAADVLGGRWSDEVVDFATALMDRSDRTWTIDEACMEAEQELLAQKKAEREAEEERRRKKAAKAKIRARYNETPVEDLFAVMGALPPREVPWHKGRKPTPRQVASLKKNGLWTKDLTFTQAHALMDRMIERIEKGLCTPRMARQLEKRGYDPNVPFEDAKKIMDQIAKREGWGRKKSKRS